VASKPLKGLEEILFVVHDPELKLGENE
jgi:hypothetical protein